MAENLKMLTFSPRAAKKTNNRAPCKKAKYVGITLKISKEKSAPKPWTNAVKSLPF